MNDYLSITPSSLIFNAIESNVKYTKTVSIKNKVMKKLGIKLKFVGNEIESWDLENTSPCFDLASGLTNKIRISFMCKKLQEYEGSLIILVDNNKVGSISLIARFFDSIYLFILYILFFFSAFLVLILL